MNFYKFLLQEEADFKGRLLSDIWNFTDDEIDQFTDASRTSGGGTN